MTPPKEKPKERERVQEELDPEFEALLSFLKRSRGFDFTGYKRPSLMRRVDKRMQELGIAGYGSYLDELQVRPDEYTHLVNSILINVTGFFRDPQIWSYLASDIVPSILGRVHGDQMIRAWSAGCASGEEAYSIAMLFADALGNEAFGRRVKIYGTDVDDEALTHARVAMYAPKAVDGVPAAMRAKYFQQIGGAYVFDKDLRRSLIFGRHDVVADPPISKVDLVLCRNTLMYLNAETQARVIGHLRYALNNGGYLVLGKAEMPFPRLSSFIPVDIKRRVFAKEGADAATEATEALLGGNNEAAGHLANYVRGRDAAFESGPIAQLVVDRNGYLILSNERARHLLGVTRADLGKPFRDLDISYRPLDLRTPIDEVLQQRKPVSRGDVAFVRASGDSAELSVECSPLFDPAGTLLGVGISFSDVTMRNRLQLELEHSNQELETALEELQSMNEELETTNEELQSTNEELETTNEELQSTNEELETMNEELQSTNEELQTVNEEARDRSDDLDKANTFLGAILMSINAAVAVLDRRMNVTVWNRRAEELWGLRPEEVEGQPFLELDIGLPVKELEEAVRAALDGRGSHRNVEISAINRRGRSIHCRVEVSSLRGDGADSDGVIVIMDGRDSEGNG